MFWFIILFPLMIYPWGFDPYYTTVKANYLYLFVFGTWAYLLFKRKYRTVMPEKQDTNVGILLLLFLCLVEISAAFSGRSYTSVYGLIDRKEGLLSYFSYVSVLLFSYRLFDMKKLNKILAGMAIVSAMVGIYGILQHYQLDFFPRNSAMRNYPGTYTFFDNPNFFGSYLVLALLVTIPIYLTAKNIKYSSLYLLTISLTFASLIFSNTRSAYLGVFFGLVFVTVFVIMKRKSLWKKWAGLLLTFGLILLVINFSESDRYIERINTVVKDSYSIATNQTTGREGSNRFFIWKQSLPLVKEYFWIGSGPDSFEFAYPNDDEEVRQFLHGSIVDKAHNEYLQMAITLGTPALITYLLLIFVILQKAFRAVKKVDGQEKVFLYGLIAAIVGYLVQAFFNISTVPVAPLFWAILGMTLARSSRVLNQAKELNNEKPYSKETVQSA
ncbi:O-antigen ligase [Bacillus sp. MRMR6]|uniref:O-antigen ligase family protein n=1 Tax=Bacillus sp. MRMR6 TaxID=1928617 RepID=UPI0009522C85|nr:O-antigen ligase family protein [Bacillus sp. MRMR6]OLS41516.1 hypothetical protein BTR25_02895 [Bacillus sp. MRMR6]